jgi:magnesium chelatase family protein
MNPCRCGRAGEPGYACRQGRGCVERYQARISGPLLDRIDLQIEVPAVSAADLVLPAASEGSAEVRARVAAARAIQAERFAALKHPRTLRVARTLADLDGEARVARIHIAEALSYRGETLRRAQAAA